MENRLTQLVKLGCIVSDLLTCYQWMCCCWTVDLHSFAGQIYIGSVPASWHISLLNSSPVF